MKRDASEQKAKGPIDLVEEAFHLLRLAPGNILACYYLGSLPFVLGLLYFWSDMSRSAFAEQRLIPGALGLTLLFFWMKLWQAVFAQQLLARLCGDPAPRWKLSRLLKTALFQAILQPSGLFLLPVALVLLFPFGWVYAFYQNATVFSGAADRDFKTVFKTARQQAMLWPLQNNYALLLCKAFAIFVFLNLISGVLAIPYLLDALFGIQTPFMQSIWTIFNTTFFAAIVGLTYLAMDPLVKTIYVLRCFYGESLQTGQDLQAELKDFLPAGKLVAVIGLAIFSHLVSAPHATGAELEPKPTLHTRAAPASVSPPELDRSIEETIRQREYTWRMPREEVAKQKPEKGSVAAFIESLFDSIKSGFKTIGRWLEKLFKWLSPKQQLNSNSGSSGFNWLFAIKGIIVVLAAALIFLLIWLVVRVWMRNQRHNPGEVTAEAMLPTPNIADENVGADQLPEDGWLKMARELLDRGELRLALRAFYLASLAHLASRNLITIAKFKSNRDYEKELGRRAHALPDVMQTFTQNVTIFDRIWYGLHEVNAEMLQHFASNVEKIKAHG